MEIKKVYICGCSANNYSLFFELYKYLLDKSIEAKFVEPELSGEAKLIQNDIDYIKFAKSSYKSLNKNGINIESFSSYSLKKAELEERFYAKILKKIVLRDATRLVEGYSSFFYDKQNVLVIVWGGYDVFSSIPLFIARSLNLKTIAVEKGSFPKTLQIGIDGTNYFNSLLHNIIPQKNLGRCSKEYLQQLINRSWKIENPHKQIDLFSKVKSYLRTEESFLHIIRKLFEICYSRITKKFDYTRNWSLTGINKKNIIKNVPQKFVFFPMQVKDDSQVLIHSDWLANQEELIKQLSKILYDMNKNVRLVVKPHPSEFRGSNLRNLRLSNVIISEADTNLLTDKSKFVITINSSVGIEALCYGKKVILIGNAFYMNFPNVYKVNNIQELIYKISFLINYRESENNQAALQYLCSLLKVLVAVDFTNPTYKEIEEFWLNIQNKIYIEN